MLEMWLCHYIKVQVILKGKSADFQPHLYLPELEYNLKSNHFFSMFCVSLGRSFKVSCFSWTSDVTGFKKNYKLFTSRCFLLALQVSQCHVCFQKIFRIWRTKTSCYWKLRNIQFKKNVPIMAMWAGQLGKFSFLCQYSTNWGIYCCNWLQFPSTLTGHPHEKWWSQI